MRRSSRGKKAVSEEEEEEDEVELHEEDEEKQQPSSKKKSAPKKAVPSKKSSVSAKKRSAAEQNDEAQQSSKSKTPQPQNSGAKKTKKNPKNDVEVVAEAPANHNNANANANANVNVNANANGRGSPGDCLKLFLQSFLGGAAKSTASAQELATRVNRFCGLHKPLATYIEEANAQMHEAALELAIKRVVHEDSGHEFFVLSNLKADEVARAAGSELSFKEKEWAERVCIGIASAGDGRLLLDELRKRKEKKAKKEKKKEESVFFFFFWFFFKKKMENRVARKSDERVMLDKLVANDILAFCGGVDGRPESVVLGVRALAELSGHLAAELGAAPPTCHLCKMPAFRRATCSCCELVMHSYCEKRWARPGQAQFCPGCKVCVKYLKDMVV